jgi:hypothetical protein
MRKFCDHANAVRLRPGLGRRHPHYIQWCPDCGSINAYKKWEVEVGIPPVWEARWILPTANCLACDLSPEQAQKLVRENGKDHHILRFVRWTFRRHFGTRIMNAIGKIQ